MANALDSLPSRALSITLLSDVDARPVEWLWPDVAAKGKLSILSGDPGLGKSLLTIATAACVSVGGRWPASQDVAETGSVLMLSAEDALDDTVKPRLVAAGADCTKVYGIGGIVDELEQREETFSLSNPEHLDMLSAVIFSAGDCKAVTIDPLSAFMGATDSHNNADVRAVLAPLAKLAEKHHIAVICVSHLNKGSGSAIYRNMGSVAFTAAARAVWGVTKDKADPDRRLVLPIKNNLGRDRLGFAYRVETAPNGAAVLMWEPGRIDVDIDDILARHDHPEGSALDDAMQWLASELDIGPVQTTELQKHAKQAGHSWATVRRAKDNLGVVAKKQPITGQWQWSLPQGAQTPPAPKSWAP